MAVTSRNLRQQMAHHAAGVAPWKSRLSLAHPYLRVGLAILATYAALMIITGWGRIWLDDVRYGRPRTQHLSGTVGHNEGSGEPTHFIAMNLNRHIIVVELPGGDATKAQVLQGPYLFGANEDLTPVTLRLQDVNGDAKNDLVLSVKQEEVIYINTGESFRLISADERAHLQKAP